MKRTAATFVMLAGLGGCATPTMTQTGVQPGATPFGEATTGKDVPGMVGPTGEPIQRVAAQKVAAAGQMPTDSKAPVVRVDPNAPTATTDSGVRPAAGFARVDGGFRARVRTPGLGCADGSCGADGVSGGAAAGSSPYGPMTSGFQQFMGRGGILPVPYMGPPGAVASVGAMGSVGGMYGPLYANQRTSIRFASPQGMSVSWQGADGTFPDTGLVSPGRYNFPQGSTYRLKLSGLVKFPTRSYYPTLEVYPATPATVTYLSHNAVPVSFTDEDFEQVNAGNLVVKVIYLPNAAYQDLAAVAGADEVVSTRLEPGVDPVAEANRRGTILAVLRVGNIDLEDKFGPAVDAPTGMPGMMPTRPAMPASPMPGTPRITGVPTTPAPLPPSAKPATGGSTISVPRLP